MILCVTTQLVQSLYKVICTCSLQQKMLIVYFNELLFLEEWQLTLTKISCLWTHLFDSKYED